MFCEVGRFEDSGWERWLGVWSRGTGSLPRVQTVHTLLHDYLAARGLTITDGHDAKKVAEEAVELVEACSRDVPRRDEVMHELADVVLAAAVIAEHHGFTVEEAIRAKIALDAGRGSAAAGDHRPPVGAPIGQ